ncbi:hypothetical protein [Rhizobium phaseoli]|uniref:hypothetical protein n=1 Tax=Rhizobium phaseoli TaxID=396 RepID=UPI0007F0727D|nr:hypothetical protein [Rhizobium phaseoli]ANL41436.1 hypothetical protein AMC88_CH03071 [Rhizobium phaseoli]ANL60424.1 hypothetical protein AMC85_CH03070 [Rhizobium phaseoli]
MDDDLPNELIASHDIEIIPPRHGAFFGAGAMTCLCCRQSRLFIDEDACGICEECLAP